MAYIYKHTRLDNDEVFYIGIGSGDEYKRAYTSKGRNPYWKRIVNISEYKVDIIEDNLSWNIACKKEIELIKKYGRRNYKTGTLCNITEGGEGFRSNHTEKTKTKISNTLRNKTYEDIHGTENADLERKKRRLAAKRQWSNLSDKERTDINKKITEGIKMFWKNNPDAVVVKTYVCPHCKRKGTGNVMKRWHFDNCKLKDNG